MLAALLLASCLLAPQESAPSAAKLPRDVSALVAKARARHGVPALGVAVWREGAIVAHGVAGVRAAAGEVPVTRGDPWHLGSCTKAMTATLCALAEERGLLHLDDTLATLYFDEGVPIHAVTGTIRLSQLLDHTSGLLADDPAMWRRYRFDTRTPSAIRAEIAHVLLARAPAAEPGARYAYSNYGYVLAGAILERVLDTSWEELMRRELFGPLGMTSAGFGPPGLGDGPDVVSAPRGHRLQGERHVSIPPGPLADNPAWLGPAGTVHASLEDWARFGALHLIGDVGGETPLLTPASFQRLHTPAEGREYASGWLALERGWAGASKRVLTHGGSNTMWFAVVWLAPERQVGFYAACNAAGPAAERACDEVIAALVRSIDE